MAESKFSFTFEEDGTVTTKTGEIAPVSHRQADDILRDTKLVLGGANKETRTPHTHGTLKGGVKVGH